MKAHLGVWGDYVHISQGLGSIREQQWGRYPQSIVCMRTGG